MEGTSVIINVQVIQNGKAVEVPVAINPSASAEKAQKTQLVAQNFIDKLQEGQKIILTTSAKVSKKILKKLLTEALPNLTLKMVKVGKVILLAAI